MLVTRELRHHQHLCSYAAVVRLYHAHGKYQFLARRARARRRRLALILRTQRTPEAYSETVDYLGLHRALLSVSYWLQLRLADEGELRCLCRARCESARESGYFASTRFNCSGRAFRAAGPPPV